MRIVAPLVVLVFASVSNAAIMSEKTYSLDSNQYLKSMSNMSVYQADGYDYLAPDLPSVFGEAEWEFPFEHEIDTAFIFAPFYTNNEWDYLGRIVLAVSSDTRYWENIYEFRYGGFAVGGHSVTPNARGSKSVRIKAWMVYYHNREIVQFLPTNLPPLSVYATFFVPEPSTTVLLLGSFLLVFYRRR